MKEKNVIIVVGFAIFSIFFGAGNLIFPPYLGLNAGDQWFLGYIFFMLADVALAIVVIFAVLKRGGTFHGLTCRLGRIPSMLLNLAVVVCLGPLLAIPRTSATTYEMAIRPFAQLSFITPLLFSIIFFGIVFLLTIKPSKVVEIIGKYLTPVLLTAMIGLIVVGIVNPLGTPVAPKLDNVIKEGIMSGYQTLDSLGVAIFIVVIISAVDGFGYNKANEKTKIVMRSALVAAAGLGIVYCGLTYLGATVSGTYDASIDQATLTTRIFQSLTGDLGMFILGIIVLLACLTTAIGLTAAVSAFFEQTSKGKIPYKYGVLVVVAASILISNLGLTAIINFATPILNVLYPVMLTMVFFAFANQWIRNDNIIRFAALFCFAATILGQLNKQGYPQEWLRYMPLYEYGFQWIVFAAAGGLVGSLIKPRSANQSIAAK